MPIEKVRIGQVGQTKDHSGQYGISKIVNIKQVLEGGDRWLSGFIPEKDYNPNDFKVGNVVELDVFQNKKDPKYWNFKKPTEKAKESAKSTNEIMDALRKIYLKLQDIERRLPDISEEKKVLSVFDEEL